VSRLDIMTPSHAQTVIDGLYRDVERRIAASPPGLCPVDLAKSFLDLCHAQTCGKCVPCRIGLGQLSELMEQVLEGEATMETISIIERVARVIVNSADCAIGRDAARLVLDGVQGFRDDYEEHILRHRCLGGMREPVPCVALCPAGVDIPGYLVLIKYGRYADAVRLIRKDNPFPSACAYICEHPCEARCRRNMIDDAVNIRGLKRYAVDNAGYVPQPDCAEPTGKKVAVIGGGPSGLSAAYYLALMGHKVTVYEKCAKLGGMLRYGIPNYRLPREVLDAEIASMLALGIDVHVNVNVGDDVTFDELRQQNDALYIALGAHTDKKTGIEGEDAEGVISAVEMLREIGDDHMPDFRNKDIVVIGGGNVAMDVCRSAVRLGARKVSCVYRRRQEDMTALPEEVEGAVAEVTPSRCGHSRRSSARWIKRAAPRPKRPSAAKSASRRTLSLSPSVRAWRPTALSRRRSPSSAARSSPRPAARSTIWTASSPAATASPALRPSSAPSRPARSPRRISTNTSASTTRSTPASRSPRRG